jgi:uncharacterized membrane protein YobD (UPF0266 family)
LNYQTYIALETLESRIMNSPPHLHCLSLHLSSRHTQQFSHTKKLSNTTLTTPFIIYVRFSDLILSEKSQFFSQFFCLNLTFRIVHQEKKILSLKNTRSRFKNINTHDLSKELDLLILAIYTTSLVYCQFLHLFF